MRGWVLAGVVLAARVALADTSAATHYKQGKAFEAAKQYDQAIVEYQAAYAIDKKPAHLYNIGRAHQLAGRAKQAIESYQKFLDADPQSPLAKEVRESVVVLTRELAEAEARVNADKKRAAAESHVKLAQAYAQQGQWIDAGNEYRAAFEADADPAHLRDAGDVYAKQDSAKARDAYLAYLDKAPAATDADAIRGKIAGLPKPVVEVPKPKSTETVITIVASRPDAKILIDQQEKGVGRWSGPVQTGGHSLRVVAPGARVYQTELTVEDGKPRTIDVPLDPPVVDLGPRVQVGLTIAPGTKRNADNPSVLLLRADLLIRIGRRIALGPVIGLGVISTDGVCGTDFKKNAPANVFVFEHCNAFIVGVELGVHVRPRRSIDPYVGVTAGIRPLQLKYDDNGMYHDDLLFGLFGGARVGVEIRPSSVLAWTIGPYVQLDYGIGKEQQQDIGGGPSYASVFGGIRTSYAF